MTPATYKTVEEQLVVRPATTRVETIPATFKMVSEQVLVKPESSRYEAIALPLKWVSEQVTLRGASSRLEISRGSLKAVSERVMVKEASKRLIEVPATYETVTERVKVADASTEWKRGRAWIGSAKEVRPVKGFLQDGRSDSAAVQRLTSDNTSLDDDVMCLVEIPERFETFTRRVVKTPASVREVELAC